MNRQLMFFPCLKNGINKVQRGLVLRLVDRRMDTTVGGSVLLTLFKISGQIPGQMS